MLHNRRLIARSCLIKSIDLGLDNYVRTVCNGRIYLALVAAGCRVQGFWCYLAASVTRGDTGPLGDSLTYRPGPGYWHISLIVPCYVQICHNVTRHLTSHHTLPRHITSATRQPKVTTWLSIGFADFLHPKIPPNILLSETSTPTCEEDMKSSDTS